MPEGPPQNAIISFVQFLQLKGAPNAKKSNHLNKMIWQSQIYLTEWHWFSYDEIADPDQCPAMNFMFPRSCMNLFLHDHLLARHHDPALIEEEIEQIRKELKLSPNYSKYLS